MAPVRGGVGDEQLRNRFADHARHARQSTKVGAYGVVAGVVLAAAVSQLAVSSFEVVPGFGLVAYAGGAVLVLAATIAAAYGPCRRAGKVRIVTALRHE